MTSSGPVNLYSRGGIANSPQVAIYGEGDTPEAYVPLPDGRTIPVTLNMPDIARMMEFAQDARPQAQAPMQLAIHVHENASDSGTEVQHDQQAGRIDIMLAKSMQRTVQSGQLDKTMLGRYGLKVRPQGT